MLSLIETATGFAAINFDPTILLWAGIISLAIMLIALRSAVVDYLYGSWLHNRWAEFWLHREIKRDHEKAMAEMRHEYRIQYPHLSAAEIDAAIHADAESLPALELDEGEEEDGNRGGHASPLYKDVLERYGFPVEYEPDPAPNYRYNDPKED